MSYFRSICRGCFSSSNAAAYDSDAEANPSSSPKHLLKTKIVESPTNVVTINAAPESSLPLLDGENAPQNPLGSNRTAVSDVTDACSGFGNGRGATLCNTDPTFGPVTAVTSKVEAAAVRLRQPATGTPDATVDDCDAAPRHSCSHGTSSLPISPSVLPLMLRVNLNASPVVDDSTAAGDKGLMMEVNGEAAVSNHSSADPRMTQNWPYAFLGLSKDLIEIGGQSSDSVPLVDLKRVAEPLALLMQNSMQMMENTDDVKNLTEDINAIAEIIAADQSINQIEHMKKVLSESKNKAREGENRSRFMKSIWSDQNAKNLEQVTKACRSFGTERGITMDRLVDKIATEMSHIMHICSTLREQFARENSSFSHGLTKLYDEWHQRYVEQALKDIPHADASYKAFVHSSKAGFLEGTRTALLEELEDWAHGRREDLADKPVYILSGAAGTGKSTIAYEIARRLDRDQILGASFFFLRGAGDLSSTRVFFSTIAYQLALFKDLFCDHISAAAKSHVMNGTQQMGFVVDELIQEPLKKVPDPQNIPPTIIVIDAVDECTDEAQERVPHMLHLLLRCVLALKVPLRILITTRPELHIEDALESAEFKYITKPFNLHSIYPQIIDKDIELYIEQRMGEHGWTKVLLEQHTDVALQLAKQADGLFIYAKVVVDFLVDKRQLAREYLNALIAKFSDSNIHRDAALARLDMLYTAVLESAFPDLRTDRSLQVQVQDVLGCVAILQDHVSPRVLCSLVGIKLVEVEFVIDHLRAIIIFNKASDAKIHPLHASFPQFLLDENRCTNRLFWVDSSVQNNRWAAACLSTLNDPGLLQRNVCHLPDPLLHKAKVSDLSTLVERHLSVHTGIQYACLHWATHLHGSGSQDVSVLVQALDMFCHKRLLFWIEALSMMGRLDVAVTALINARDWYAAHSSTQDNTYLLLNDAYRLILEYYTPIDCCPEQIYISALTFSPSCHLRDQYADMIDPSIAVRVQHEPCWGPCMRICEIGDHIALVRFSSDGGRIVSANSGGKMHILDAGTGTILNTMKHEEPGDMVVSNIQLSPDDQTIICFWEQSGLEGPVCQIWNASSGALLRRFHPTGIPLDAAFTPDGKSIVVVTRTDVQTIDVRTGDPSTIVTWSSPLPGRGPLSIYSIHFFADERQVVLSAEYRKAGTVDLWDGDSGELRHTFAGHTGRIRSMAFFPDDTKLVVADDTPHIRIWDVRSGACSQVVDISSGHTADEGGISCMIVSPAGHRLAVGLTDVLGGTMTGGKIIIIDCNNWHTLAVVSFPHNIRDICFSPRGDRLVSASAHGLIIYDTAAMEGTTYIESNWLSSKDWRTAVVFSPDGTQIATYSGFSQEDSAIDIWTISNNMFVHSFKHRVPYDVGAPFRMLLTNSDTDGQLGIIIVRRGQPVLLRDVTTWTLKASTPEAYGLNMVCFSPDGQCLATASESGTVTMRKTSDLSECWTVDVSSFSESIYGIRISPDRTNVLLYRRHNICYRRLICALNFSTGELVERIDRNVKWRKTNLNWDHLCLDRAGWILSKKSHRKWCWLPPVLRPAGFYEKMSCNNHFAILSANHHFPFTVLNLSSLIETSAQTASASP